MIALLATVLVSSLAGSLHCAAMCGPFAGLAGGASTPRWTPHLAYGLARLGGYLVLGVVAGAVGAAVDVVGELATVGRVAMVIAGVGMLIWGLRSLALALGRGGAAGPAGSPGPMLYAIRRQRPVARGAALGLLTATLPCGWLYAFVLIAAGTGSLLGGAAVMATFWLGSTPALLGAGLSMRALARRLGRRLPVVTASLQIAVAVTALLARAPMLDHRPTATGAIPEAPSCH